MPVSFRFALSLLLLMSSFALPAAQEDTTASASSEQAAGGTLAELRDKHRVWLIVRRGALLDARGADESVLSEVYREGNLRQNYPRTFNLIARKLNKYMKEHGSITAAQTLSDSEFIIFFNVLEIRRPLGTPYAYGELFVVLSAKSNKSKPRVIWKTKSGGMFVDEAIGDLISELKAVRGER
jgi:hypothetical protein